MKLSELLEDILYNSSVSPEADVTIDGENIEETSFCFGTKGYCTQIDLRRESFMKRKRISASELVNRIHKYCSDMRRSETEMKLDLEDVTKLYRGTLL